MTKSSIFDNPAEIKQRQLEIALEENRGCQRCGATEGVVRYHQRTMYPYGSYGGKPGEVDGDENDPNYVTLCPPCKQENDDYWEERWEEYYRGLL